VACGGNQPDAAPRHNWSAEMREAGQMLGLEVDVIA